MTNNNQSYRPECKQRGNNNNDNNNKINSKGVDFFNTLGRRISACTSDIRETAFLFQRLSLTIQRFNAVRFNESFCFKNADLDS